MTFNRTATFRQLATFHAVVRLRSVSKAAQELNLTQPAVSIQISNLELSAGTPLLQRQGRGIRVTEAGELLAGYAARILDLWREAGEEIATMQGVFSGTLRVGAVSTAEYVLPPRLVAFANEHPRVTVKLHTGNRTEIVRMLAGQEIDLAVMGRPPAELQTIFTAFAKHPMGFVAAPDHPLMHVAHLELRDVSTANLLVRERGSGTRATVEHIMKHAGFALRARSELSSNEAIKQLCAAGFGIAFLSLHTCALELETGRLALLPLDANPVERDWYVIQMRTRRLPHVAQAFAQFLAKDRVPGMLATAT